MNYKPEEDGITHLNVYSHGRTCLGKWLSNFSRTPFVNPRYGIFESMEGFWYWLATGKNRPILKKLWGFNAKKTGRTFARIQIDNFQEEIIYGLRCKLNDYPDRKLELKLSTLPLTHYYVMHGKVIIPKDNKWFIKAISDIRKELQEQ